MTAIRFVSCSSALEGIRWCTGRHSVQVITHLTIGSIGHFIKTFLFIYMIHINTPCHITTIFDIRLTKNLKTAGWIISTSTKPLKDP